MSKNKPTPAKAAPDSRARTGGSAAVWLPLLAVIGGLVYVAITMFPQHERSPFRFDEFVKLPVLQDGRIKPIDTVARSSLMLISNRQTIVVGGRRLEAVEWLLDVMARPEKADGYPVVRVDHPDIQALLADPAHTGPYNYFSYREIAAKFQALDSQFKKAFEVEEKNRNLFQTKLLDLSRRLRRYQDINAMAAFVPVLSGDRAAVSAAAAIAAAPIPATQPNEAQAAFLAVVDAYHNDRPGDFSAAADAYRQQVTERDPELAGKSAFESFFQQAQPFYHAMVLYVLVFLLAAISWLGWTKPLGRAAAGITAVALLLHTFGMAARVYVHGHPPITNLYASSIFVGWAAVILALILELIYRNAIGSATAGITGFLTLLVAHNLSDGDNLEAVRAVLDTNLWLSTHVTIITIGYGSTFLAGFLATVYVIRGVLTRSLTPETARGLTRMIYGILCFAVMASFIGTVLGGIWADQSWGRFWGWDPKENGALLIVLMNALILHAYWEGMVAERGMAVLAIAGNIVTSWSWFGVNMLGVGLHSYGFMDKALNWLIAFAFSQLALMALGMVPLRYWRSIRPDDDRAVSIRDRSRGKPAAA